MAGATVASGYGRPHRRVREQVAPIVATGRALCARCGLPIAVGEPWDLDHDDLDRRRYLGPSHARCNRAAPHHRERRRSRAW